MFGLMTDGVRPPEEVREALVGSLTAGERAAGDMAEGDAATLGDDAAILL